MLLRGDPSDGPRAEWTPTEGGLTYAVELVELARSRGDFRIGVAAFPEGHPSAELAGRRRRRAGRQGRAPGRSSR